MSGYVSAIRNLSVCGIFASVAVMSAAFALDPGQAPSSGNMWGTVPNAPPAFMLASAAQDPNALPDTALNMAAGAAKDSLIPAIFPNAPGWLKRTEWGMDFTRNNGSQYNILTTQPLWQSDGKIDTLFTQVSYEHYNLYDIGRNTVNAGLGYRRLAFDNNLLLGINSFYDYELSHHHERASVGGDAKWGPLDFFTNHYFSISGAKAVTGATERVMNGTDAGLGSQLPYLPWATVYGRYYEWQGIVGKSVFGSEFSTELALHPNLTLVGGTMGDMPDSSRRNNYIMLQFTFGDNGKPTLLTHPVASQAFTSRDLSGETLDKVRRENRIIVERATKTSGGVTVVVKKG